MSLIVDKLIGIKFDDLIPLNSFDRTNSKTEPIRFEGLTFGERGADFDIRNEFDC